MLLWRPLIPFPNKDYTKSGSILNSGMDRPSWVNRRNLILLLIFLLIVVPLVFWIYTVSPVLAGVLGLLAAVIEIAYLIAGRESSQENQVHSELRRIEDRIGRSNEGLLTLQRQHGAMRDRGILVSNIVKKQKQIVMLLQQAKSLALQVDNQTLAKDYAGRITVLEKDIESTLKITKKQASKPSKEYYLSIVGFVPSSQVSAGKKAYWRISDGLRNIISYYQKERSSEWFQTTGEPSTVVMNLIAHELDDIRMDAELCEPKFCTLAIGVVDTIERLGNAFFDVKMGHKVRATVKAAHDSFAKMSVL
jgi:hypothetical protein